MNVTKLPKRCTCPANGGCTEKCSRKNKPDQDQSGEMPLSRLLQEARDEADPDSDHCEHDISPPYACRECRERDE
jgi:hypothetical protein